MTTATMESYTSRVGGRVRNALMVARWNAEGPPGRRAWGVFDDPVAKTWTNEALVLWARALTCTDLFRLKAVGTKSVGLIRTALADLGENLACGCPTVPCSTWQARTKVPKRKKRPRVSPGPPAERARTKTGSSSGE